MKSGFVALIGRPNAGKSTLLNRLVGQKLAIVSDKPQTTRNRITGVRNFPEGQVVFVDTPGVHRPLHRLNVRMVDAALDALREVDVAAVIVDATEAPGGGDRYLVDVVKKVDKPRVLVLNKVDAVHKDRLLPMIERYSREDDFSDIVPVSALTGDNVERLEQVLLSRLPDGQPLYDEDYLTDQPERFFVAELVREQVLRHTRAELPFSSAVIVDRFEEPDAKGLLRLYSRRARIAEAHRDRPGRRDDQSDWLRRAEGARSLLRHPRVSRPASEGQGRLARGRAHARHIGPAAGKEAPSIRCSRAPWHLQRVLHGADVVPGR
jgi:GTP-binding protein Era